MSGVNGSGMTICNQIKDPHVNRDPKAYRTVTTQTNGVWRVTLIESTTWGTFCQPIKISGNPSEYYAANPSIYYLRYRKAASASVKVYRGGVQCAAGADWLAWLVDGSGTEVNPILELDGPRKPHGLSHWSMGASPRSTGKNCRHTSQAAYCPHPG